MSNIDVEQYPEVLGAGRLGRHREHDARSRSFAVPEPAALPTVTYRWARRSPILDQGSVGSCTGNAMAGAIGTDTEGRYGAYNVDEALALELYSLATELDRVPGIYPPDDVGSSGLAVAKAARNLGKITGYRHAFSVRAAAAALRTGPVIVGMLWLTGCDTPDESGLIRYEGDVRGGHEVLLRGWDADRQLFEFDNSWGPLWGSAGSFHISAADFTHALKQGGDVTVPLWS